MLTAQRGQTREYRDETGAEFFSVTQIRRMAFDPYVGIPPATLEAARQRGTLLHRRFWKVLAAQNPLLGVSMPPVLPGLEGYCEAMDRWVREHHVQPVKLEEASCHRKMGYAGTADAQVWYDSKRILTLMDLKTGEPTVTDPMQLLAYRQMDGYEGSRKLLDLYVRADGRAIERWVSVKDAAHQWAWLLAALGVLKGRLTHGCR